MVSRSTIILWIVQLTNVVYAEKHDISNIETEITLLNAKVKSLAEKYEDGMKHVDELVTSNDAILQKNRRLRNILAKYVTKTSVGNEQKQQLKTEEKLLRGRRSKKALEFGDNVAFSAYLDHNVNNIGQNQTIKFNQVLLNDGNAYNYHSGIFTAPIAGVYSFSFFIGQRGVAGSWIQLFVNSENKMDGAVDTFHDAQDLQGGNVANLKLAQNDIVYVRFQGGTGHLEGSDSHRVTSFSGFLVYPVENGAVIG